MTAIAAQFAAGIDQAMSALGVTATFTCNATQSSVSLLAALSDPAFDVDSSGNQIMLAANTWVVLLRTADLQFSGTVYEPAVGDTIAVTAGGFTYTHTVLLPDGLRYCWTWADRFRVRRKLFTKLTSVVAA